MQNDIDDVSKGELIFMFDDFDIDSSKNFSPRRWDLWNLRPFKMKFKNNLMKLNFVFDKSSKIHAVLKCW